MGEQALPHQGQHALETVHVLGKLFMCAYLRVTNLPPNCLHSHEIKSPTQSRGRDKLPSIEIATGNKGKL